MFHFAFNMFPDLGRQFNTVYRCFSVSMLPGQERQEIERGGKIIMPPSALENLTRLNVNYPMLFKLTNKQTTRITHCGVLEFVADEGRVYLPLWMMHNLLLEEGDCLQVESVTLPVATFSKFQPQTTDFLDITNPKAVLENGLRNFACLTTGDMIAIMYNQKIYELCVLETKPGDAVSIIECDMNVEFAAPLDYKEPEVPMDVEEENEEDTYIAPAGFRPFSGKGNRLDGKPKKDTASSVPVPTKQTYVRGIPDYDYKIGSLKFLRNSKPPKEYVEKNEEFKPFQGTSYTLNK